SHEARAPLALCLDFPPTPPIPIRRQFFHHVLFSLAGHH
ncbi:hypothetical protein NGA_2071300, partial [Nannochloropsis gaditana CCMP526]